MKKFLQKLTEDTTTHNPVVMTFGRMNPPTIGHEKLVNKVKDIAADYNAPHHVIISHSQDAKKNPLDVKSKLKHANRFFPNTNIEHATKEAPTFLQHAARLNQAGHDHLVMVAGSDRVDEYQQKLNQYNGEGPGKLYNFKKIEVKSAGERDPDAEGAEGMSASKMRQHAKNNDFTSFKQGVPAHLPEKHAKELFRDVRKGMGLNESADHGLFKAIFVSGGPGSGKDIIIREAIGLSNAVELNVTLASAILNDKHKLSEQSRDERREALRNRKPLIINGTANESTSILAIKEELEDLGYETMMIFVNTSNEASRKRNEGHVRMMSESMRQERWELTQLISEQFNEKFGKYLEFDNSLDLTEATDLEIAKKEEDVSIIYEMCNWFFAMNVENEIAESWLHKRKKLSIDKLFENFLSNPVSKGYKKYVSESKTTRKTINAKTTGRKPIADNNCPSCQLAGKEGRIDSVTDGDVKPNTSYTFRTYHEANEPHLEVKPTEKETKFQQDNDKEKAKKLRSKNYQSGKVINPGGTGPEYDTRGSGTVYPMSGLGQVTYREQKENKYTSTADGSRKSFSKFRTEAIDSPGNDMGVTGGEYGPSNKEPMDSLNKIETNLKKKTKTEKKNVQ